MARTERQIWRRHKVTCPHSKADDPRSKRNCECPIYARVTILSPDSDEVLFRWPDQSLGKLGIRHWDAAERLVDKWFKDYLSGDRKPQAEVAKKNRTVREVVDEFFERLEASLKPKLKPEHKGDPKKHLTYRKYSAVIRKLVPFAKDREVPLIKQIDTAHLFTFQESWVGRQERDKDGKIITRPKTDVGKDRDQGLLKKFFEWSRMNGYIDHDPAERLESISAPKAAPKPFTASDEAAILDAIPRVFPQTHDVVRAFVLLQKYSACRISAVATAEIANLQDDGIWLRERKTERGNLPNYVWCLLPPEVVATLRAVKPKSAKYFFWTGESTLKTLVSHWTGEYLKLFRAAGIDGKRSHEWRDTIGERLQNAGADLEHIQAVLNHKSKATTEKAYVSKNKRRYAEVDDIKRQLWGITSATSTPSTSAAPPPTPATLPKAGQSIVNDLRELERMFKEGLMTREEFDDFKRSLMRHAS